MPIASPQLDDLTYDRIVTELIRRIPVYSPEWTDFNDSDPGITLIQLFAYLTEMVGYRLNQVPQKSQVNLLQLLGVTLNPARPATTQLALLLTDPTKLTAYTLAKGASVKASTGSPPPAFETNQDLVVVPIEPVVLLTTKYPDIRQSWNGETTSSTSKGSDYLTVVWDGQSPKLKDMPLSPVTLAPVTNQRYLWIGVQFNSDASAGALGARVQLTIQYDADDQPAPTAAVKSGFVAAAAQLGAQIDWFCYYDAQTQHIVPLPGRIEDTTNQLANSGTLTFVVPPTVGPVPPTAFLPLYPSPPTPPPPPNQTCVSYANNMQTAIQHARRHLPPPNPTPAQVQAWIQAYSTAVTTAIQNTLRSVPPTPTPPIPNPLDPKFYNTMGWFRIDLRPAPGFPLDTFKLRIATFNAVGATNSNTVTNEILGVADGTPGQTYQLANGNIQPATLSLAVQEAPAANNTPLVPWTAVASLDPYGPFDSVFVLDAEVGSVTFGDGIHGRIPPLVPQGGNIVALTYVWGGGAAGNVAVGTVTVVNSAAPGIASAVNYVAATGGSDAETQDQATTRAGKTLSTGSRAVSADDFAWMAMQTPGVQVARAQVVPLRKPADQTSAVQAVTATGLAAQVPAGPAGLADNDTPGAVSVIVVPQQSGPEPTPSAAFLNAVSQYLEPQRLITTEVYVVPPQYLRLYNVGVSVAGRPGYTRAQLQSSVSAQLAGYLHVLTGGDGSGFPFGGELHIAALIAQVYRADGVARVDTVTADFVRTRSTANPRQGSLTLAPAATSTTQYNSLSLAPEESVSFDAATFVLSTVV